MENIGEEAMTLCYQVTCAVAEIEPDAASCHAQ